MAEPDQKFRFFKIAALCGALGVASGYAIFLNYDELAAQPGHQLAALLGAAMASYVIEWLRDLIRHGEIETETHPIVRSVGTFIVVLLFELFVSGFHGGLEMGSGAIVHTATSLLGDDAVFVEGISWTVFLVSGIWIVAGALLAGWLSLQIGLDEDKPTSRHVLSSARWGAVGGLVIAPAIIGLYILAGRTLVALQLFITAAPAESARYQPFVSGLQSSGYNAFFAIFHLPLGILRLAANGSLSLFWFCYLGLYLVLAIILSLRERWANRGGFSGAMNILVFGLFYCVLNPLVQSIWAVLKQLMQQKSLIALVDAVFLGAVVWGIPGFLLGGLVPLLKRAARTPQSWAFIGYGAAALLIVASLLSQLAWPLIPAAIALISGLLFQRGMPVKQFWPFAALCVAIGISGAMSVSQRLTFNGVLLNLHRIDELPTPPGSPPSVVRNSTPALVVDPRSLGLNDEQAGELIKRAVEDRKNGEKNAKILEVAIVGSVGFWITVGLLACWSMYEHQFEPE